MAFELRDYQKEAVEAGLSVDNGILCLSTGAGKSLVARGLVEGYGPKEKTLILQPSAEILESNIVKAHDAGLHATAYSASYGQKEISDIMYATVKSIVSNKQEESTVRKKKRLRYIPHEFMEEFKGCRIILDESHGLNPEEGQFMDLIDYLNPKSVIGLTATPYRAARNSLGTTMRIQTRTRPKFFKDIVYTKSTSSLISDGWLMQPKYVEIDTKEDMLVLNSTGSDYTKKSLAAYEDDNDIESLVLECVRSVIDNHNHVLVFVSSVEIAKRVVNKLSKLGVISDEVNAKTPKNKRKKAIKRFLSGEVKVMLNCQVFTTGFDFPALDAIVDARPIMSASLHYQKIGRIVRLFEGKNGIVYDLAGNLKRLSDPLQYKLLRNHRGLHELYSQKGRMTSIPISDEPEWMFEMTHGKYKGEHIRMLPDSYIEWYLKNKNDGPNTPTLDMLYSEKIMRNWASY